MYRIVLTVLVVAIIVAVIAAGCQRSGVVRGAGGATGDLQTTRVERGTIVATVFAVGNVVPSREAHLAFPIMGTVRSVNVSEGDRVEAGQVLASLDTADLEREVTNAELNLAIREAELSRLKAGPSETELAAAQATLKAAQEALDAIKAGPTEAEVAAARSALKTAQARYKQVTSQPDPEAVRQAELQLEQAKNSLWHAQAQRDMACSIEKAKSLCDSFEAEVGNMYVAVQMAQLALERAKAPAGEAEVEEARSQVQLAQERLNKLLAGPDPVELAAAEERVAQARAQLEKLTVGASPEERRIAEARVQQARLALQQAQKRLADATLVAPFAGVVAAINYQVGDVVRPDWTGITLVDPSQLDIKVNVAEVDIGRIQIGQEAEIILDAMPQRVITGRVVNIAPAARSEQGVVNYPVTVRLTEDAPEVKPGMTGNVRIMIGQREDVLLVPNRAVRRSKGRYVVVRVEKGQLIETPIRIGLSNDAVTEVLEGLKEGDRVVLNPTAVQSGLEGSLLQGQAGQ